MAAGAGQKAQAVPVNGLAAQAMPIGPDATHARPRCRNYREERGDFTIPIILLMVLLLGIAAAAYAWPKAISTRLNVEHIGEEALKIGVIHATQDSLASDSESSKLQKVEVRAQKFIERSRLNGVTLGFDESPSCGEVAGQAYVRAVLEWSFVNPKLAVDIPRPITQSTQFVSTPDLGICD